MPNLFESGEPETEEVSTRDLGKLVAYYNKHVRPSTSYEKTGVIRIMRAAMKKGITLEMFWQAIKNYQADPFVAGLDSRLRKHVRSFFAYENVLAWQRPVQNKRPGRPVDPALAALERVDSHMPPPAVDIKPVEIEEDEDEDEDEAIL